MASGPTSTSLTDPCSPIPSTCSMFRCEPCNVGACYNEGRRRATDCRGWLRFYVNVGALRVAACIWDASGRPSRRCIPFRCASFSSINRSVLRDEHSQKPEVQLGSPMSRRKLGFRSFRHPVISAVLMGSNQASVCRSARTAVQCSLHASMTQSLSGCSMPSADACQRYPHHRHIPAYKAAARSRLPTTFDLDLIFRV